MEREGTLRRCALISAMLLAIMFLLPLAVITPFPRAEAETAGLSLNVEKTPDIAEEMDSRVILRVLKDTQVEQMDLRTYLTGVVRAEMPAAFEPEALKAQAVAARTYTIYKIQSGGNHGDTAHICTDSACCQAYVEEAAARENWGEAAEDYAEKVAAAVRETDGEVILYGGVPILAVFHAASAGLTRAAGEVWQQDLPYLQPVVSLEEGAAIPNYYSRVEFTAESFRKAVRDAFPEVNLSDDPGSWLKNAVTDEAGSVETVTVGDIVMKGSQLRSILGLRSACFTWEVQGRNLVFFVTGYGHGVGLSQYGANQMALQGEGYQNILRHYYTGVTVEVYPFTNVPQA